LVMPNPLMLASGPLSSYFNAPVAWEFVGYTLYTYDWMLFDDYLPKPLQCECGKPLTRDGFSKCVRVVRSALGLAPALCKYAVYRCRGCAKAADGAESSSYTALDAFIYDQLPQLLRAAFPLVVASKRTVLAASSADAITALRCSGLAFTALESCGKEVDTTRLARAELGCLLLAEHERNTLKRPSPLPYAPLARRQLLVNAVSANIATRVVVKVQAQRDAVQQASFKRAARHANSLSYDMTHPFGANKTESGGIVLLHVMSHSREMLVGCLLESKKLGPVVTILEELCALGKVKAIWSDNMKAEAARLIEKLGDGIYYLTDTFHLLMLLYDELKDSPMRATFMRNLSECFFELCEEDVISKTERMFREGKSQTDIAAFFDDWAAVTKSGEVRRMLRKPNDIIEAVAKLIMEQAGNQLFKPGFLETWANVRASIEHYVFEPPNVPLYVNVGTPEKPKWIVLRGTSLLESFHHFLDNAGVGDFNETTGHAIYMELLTRWNHMQKINTLQRGLIPELFDLLVMDAIVAAYSKVEVGFSFDTHPLRGHVVLGQDADDGLKLTKSGMHGVPLGSSSSAAFDLFVASHQNSEQPWMPPTALRVPPLMRRVPGAMLSAALEPRALNRDSRDLALLLAKSGLFCKGTESKSKWSESSGTRLTAFWLLVYRGVGKAFRLDDLALSYNFCAYEAQGEVRLARFRNLPDSEPVLISAFSRTWDARKLWPASPTHIKEVLETYAAAVAKNQLVQSHVDVPVATVPATAVLVRETPPPPPQPPPPVAVAAPAEAAPAGAATVDAAATSKKPRFSCEFCEGKHAETSKCAFYLYFAAMESKDEDVRKRAPIDVVRMRLPSGAWENRQQALRRTWRSVEQQLKDEHKELYDRWYTP